MTFGGARAISKVMPETVKPTTGRGLKLTFLLSCPVQLKTLTQFTNTAKEAGGAVVFHEGWLQTPTTLVAFVWDDAKTDSLTAGLVEILRQDCEEVFLAVEAVQLGVFIFDR